MVLDVLIRYLPSLDYPTLGRSLFTGADARPLPNGIEVWQGYFQSARPAVGQSYIERKRQKLIGYIYYINR